MPRVLTTALREAARRFGERAALVTPVGWPLDYAELERLTAQVAGGLHARGVRPGDVVGLVLPSGPEFVVAYLAAARLGATTAGVNVRLDPAERARLLATGDPALVVGTAELLDGLEVDAPTGTVREAAGPDELLADWRGHEPAPTPPGDPDRAVAIVFTSGTTGPPKGAVFTDRQLAGIRAIDYGDGWGGGSHMLLSTEPVHVGFMTKLAWYLRAGMTMHQLRKWRARDALRIVAERDLATVGGIPAQIALMLREPGFDELDLSSVQTIVTGGGPVPPALLEEATRRFDAGFSVRYSSTESGGVGTGTDPTDLEECRHTVGRPREGVEVRIRTPEGDALPCGGEGVVTLRSAAVMDRYWRDPEATAETLRDGWLFTSDLGVLDGEGRLRLAGRRSEMYIRGGYNVHPQRVEAALLDHPGVAAVGAAPRPDPVMGEIGVAVVVPAGAGSPPDLAELRAFAADRLARHELPEDLVVVGELPLTSMHKLDRDALRELAAETGS